MMENLHLNNIFKYYLNLPDLSMDSLSILIHTDKDLIKYSNWPWQLFSSESTPSPA